MSINLQQSQKLMSLVYSLQTTEAVWPIVECRQNQSGANALVSVEIQVLSLIVSHLRIIRTAHFLE